MKSVQIIRVSSFTSRFDQFKKPDMLVAETVKTYFDERFEIRNSPVIIHRNGTCLVELQGPPSVP